MSCKIIRNKENRVQKVLAPNGKESNLYRDLKRTIPSSIEPDPYILKVLNQKFIQDLSKNEVALALWSKVYTPEFEIMFKNGLRDENGEPKLVKEGGAYILKGETETLTLVAEGEFPVENENYLYQIETSEVQQVNPRLDNELTSYLNELGVDVKILEKVTSVDKEGNPINVYGRAKLIENVVEVAKERREDTLAEEAAHVVTAMLGMNHPVVKQMMNKIDSYEVYNEVGRDYSGVYVDKDGNPDENMIRFEAVGKLIAKHIVNKEPLRKEQREETTNWFERLMRVFRNLINPVSFSNVKKEIDIFEQVAENILDKKYRPSTVQGFGSEVFQTNELEKFARDMGMDKNGFFQNDAESMWIKTRLIKRGLTLYNVTRSPHGGRLYLTSKSTGKKVNPFENNRELYQLNTPSQGEIVKKVEEWRKSIKTFKIKDEFGRDRYVDISNEVIAHRITDLQAQLFEKNKTKAEVEKIQNSIRSLIAKETGTQLHSIFENYIDTLANSDTYENLTTENRKKGTKEEQFPEVKAPFKKLIANSSKKLLNHINQQQQEIDPQSRAVILTEAFVRGKLPQFNNEETGGSIDLMVTFSDGSISLYDFKFINFKKELIGDTYQVNPETGIPFYKVKPYEIQIGAYKQLLKEELGVKNFRETRILPNNVQFKYDADGNVTKEIYDLETFEIDGEKKYLLPLPVTRELTNNERINKLLTSLFNQVDVIENLIKKNYADRKKTQELTLKRNLIAGAIQTIQLSGDLAPLLDSFNFSLRKANISKIQDFSPSNVEELNRIDAESKLIGNMINLIIPEIKNSTLKDEFLKVNGNLASLRVDIQEKRKELLLQEDPNINTPQKELGFLTRNFAYMSQIANPVFEIARKYINLAYGKTYADTQIIIEEIKEKKDNLEKWAKARGMSLIDAYKMLKDKNLNKLIFTYSKDFFDKRKEAIETDNVKWIKSIYKEKDNYKEQYEKDLEAYERSLELAIPSEKIREIELEKWKNKNDLNRDTAWLNKWSINHYLEVKEPQKFYSDEYKNLLKPENKELKEYFDWYIQMNRRLNELVGERIDDNFVANIQKDIIDSIAQDGNIFSTIKRGKQQLVNSLRLRQNDDTMGTEEGELPLLYYDSLMFKNEKGEWTQDTASINEDLTYNMIMFSEAVYRKHNMGKITDIITLLKTELSEQQVMKTDALGKPIMKNGEYLLDTSAKNLNTFETMINALVYGKTLQTEDKAVTINNKVLSTNKIMKSVITYFTTKSLSLNYISAFGNAVGGYANLYFKGKGGRYYTTAQVAKTHKLLTNRGDRDIYNRITTYFNVDKPHWLIEDASRLSASAITKHLTFDEFYILQKKGDEFISNTILVSMMQNYGLDSNGDIKRLAELPEGTKNLLDSVNIINDKIQVEGLTPENFEKFRNMVRYVSRQIKGQNASNDTTTISTTLWGRAIMQFRSFIAPMAKERFGGTIYTKEVEEWETGRYISLFDSLRGSFLVNTMKLSVSLLAGSKHYIKNIDQNLLEKQFNQFKEKNPQLKDIITLENYIELRERTIRETIVELRTISAMLLLMLFLNGDYDDDGREDYKDNYVWRQSRKLIERVYLETSFWSNPASFRELIKTPVPLVSVLQDAFGFVSNTAGEGYDLVTKDIWGIKDDKDKKPKGHYTKKFLGYPRVIEHLTEGLFDDAN